MTKQDRTELASQLRDAAALLESGAMSEMRVELVRFATELARREVTGRAKTAIGASLKGVLGKCGITVDWTPDDK